MTKNIAYATRYGHISLADAMNCDGAYLRSLIDCWSDIITKENGK